MKTSVLWGCVILGCVIFHFGNGDCFDRAFADDRKADGGKPTNADTTNFGPIQSRFIGDCAILLSTDHKRCEIRISNGSIIHTSSTMRLKQGVIDWLSKSDQIEELRISDLFLGPDVLKGLGKFANLKRFYAIRTNFSDKHAEHLLDCRNLNSITIQQRSQLTDQSFKVFSQLNGIEYLCFADVPFLPFHTKSKLSKALPDTEIVFYATGYVDDEMNESENVKKQKSD